ncbi:MAG: hypothetical protein H6741_00355 [Alphaproteobacteria bacterium]|nr:hypothetical protein [Alphaproteobacteria bacterium]MCB9791155.1 hypothetical protein [Alphaproteobacteria bacterium]
MPYVIIAAIALVIGLVVGSAGPRAELRALEDRLAEAEAQECKPAVGSELAALLTAGARGGRGAPRPPDDPRAEADRLARENPEIARDLEDIDARRDEARSQMREDLQDAAQDDEGLTAARTVLELRRAQARAALVERANPDGAQLDEIDAAVADMNDALYALADDIVVMLNEGQEPTRRDAMVFAADALDTMIVAEDRITGALDADQLEALEDGSVDPFSYVDPGLVDVLSGLAQE